MSDPSASLQSIAIGILIGSLIIAVIIGLAVVWASSHDDPSW